MKEMTRILTLAMAFAPIASFAAEISLGAPYCFVDPYKTLYHTSDLCNGSSWIDGWALSYADVAEIAGDEKYRDRFHRYDMGKVLTIRPGRYTQTIISKTGAAVTVRDTDGIHLSFTGAKIVAENVLRTYWPDKK